MNNKRINNNQYIQLNKNINRSPFPGLRLPITHHPSLITLLFLLSLLFLLFSCDTTNPGNNTSLSLTALDASCTEVWLKVETEPNLVGTELTLFRDKEEYGSFTLTGTDTVLFADGLMPSTNYTFFAQINGIPSNTVNITTMDTTSHDFNWQTFTFGDGSGGSSYLNDVAIVDENNIWAVGMIYENGEKYGAIHWDGISWNLVKVANSNYQRRTVFAFSENDVWFDGKIKWNGASWSVHTTNFPLDTDGNSWIVNAMWGKSSDDFYVVGNGGNIAHYDGSKWNKIDVNTTLPIQDIVGFSNEADDIGVIVIASDKFHGGGPVLYEIRDGNIIELETDGLSWSISSLFYPTKYRAWIVGGGIFEKSYGKGANWIKMNDGITEYYSHTICGDGINNVFVAGSHGEIVHFNGISWKKYLGTEIEGFYGNLFSVQLNKETVCSVGEGSINGQKGVLILGTKF
ncbi:MAG: hypothetical protein K9J12_11170 [Melioribacteraceae bacterium]|nr:hypothetical protein [Melioribacteraceae bacterium]MCF8266179.1 hypothetical protein [Melioribacteraceae bacterium]